jgi:hypothetical protein
VLAIGDVGGDAPALGGYGACHVSGGVQAILLDWYSKAQPALDEVVGQVEITAEEGGRWLRLTVESPSPVVPGGLTALRHLVLEIGGEWSASSPAGAAGAGDARRQVVRSARCPQGWSGPGPAAAGLR